MSDPTGERPSPYLVFDRLAGQLVDDPERDVSVDGLSLLADGKRFAYLDDDSLVIRLPAERADDLLHRNIGELGPFDADEGESWIRITDVEDWPELAGEAHDFTSGRIVGGES